jgi:hypothetical protein
LQADAPARVTITFPELSGDSTLHLSRPAPFAGGPIAPNALAPPNMSALGSVGTLSSAGDMGVLLVWDAPPETTADVTEGCYYGGPAAALAALPTAFEPGCAGGTKSSDYAYLQNADKTGIFWTLTNFPADNYGLGGSLTHAGSHAPSGVGWAYWDSFRDGDPIIDEGGVASPSPAVPAPSGGAAPPPAHVAQVGSDRIPVRGRRARVRLHCPSGGPCVGRLGLVGARAMTYRVPGGHSVTLRIPVPRRDRVRHRAVLRHMTRDGVRTEVARFPVRLVTER